MTTIEEAERCPKCKVTGEHRNSTPGKNGATVRSYYCMNSRCSWFETAWIVQVNADGSIPERSAGAKDFAALTPGQEAMARRVIEDAVQSDLRDSKGL